MIILFFFRALMVQRLEVMPKGLDWKMFRYQPPNLSQEKNQQILGRGANVMMFPLLRLPLGLQLLQRLKRPVEDIIITVSVILKLILILKMCSTSWKKYTTENGILYSYISQNQFKFLEKNIKYDGRANS